MTSTSASNPSSIFENGNLRPGVYKIHNIYAKTYLDVEIHSRELRSIKDPGEGRGLWEIKPLGAGYTIRRVEPGKPNQFCAPMVGLQNGSALSVCAYPVAWRIEVVKDDIHRGFEYVRFYWGTMDQTWNIPHGTSTRVEFWVATPPCAWFIWELIPVRVEGVSLPSGSSFEALGSGSPPSYAGDATGQSSRTQHTESEHDDFGTIVTEVTTIRKRYRVEDI